MKRSVSALLRLAAAIAWLYLITVFALVTLDWALDGRVWWLETLTSLRFYWLAPVVVVPLVAFAAARRRLLVAGLGAVALFSWLFGGLWLSRHTVAESGRPSLTVASYNALVISQNVPGVISTIRETDADVIGFQELGPDIAAGIRGQLAEEYPFQILDVENAVISRFPITRTHTTLPGTWGPDSPPQVYRIDFRGTPVTLINTHQFASITFDLRYAVPWVLQMRQQQAETVAEFARQEIGRRRPVIMTTDLNATDQNGVHRIIRRVMHDAWREAGWGLGLTWRSQHQVPAIGPIGWLARIDHVFHSNDWTTVSARLGQWDGRSDHRPVIARLQLRAER
ncbi:MAG: endonuclease/exonuclease/phosphatase family protein [Ardenticatenia bacterium]|nr:endonuclease/exonuclease/phosphatase family protein [Ardenticatenia bacterium]